ncbi:MAG: DUF4345 domain-containing protein [Bacteroidota bacterium]
MNMQHTTALKIVLGLAGLLVIIPGVMALFNPTGFTARNGAEIGEMVSVLNDYRGLGAWMLGSGVVMLLGILHRRMAFTSTVVAILTHLGLSLGRLISLAADGMPAKGLIAATVVEGVVGLLAVFALMRFREKDE